MIHWQCFSTGPCR